MPSDHMLFLLCPMPSLEEEWNLHLQGLSLVVEAHVLLCFMRYTTVAKASLELSI